MGGVLRRDGKLERVNRLYYAFSDDLNNTDTDTSMSQSIWKESPIQLKIRKIKPLYDSCRCIILNKKVYNPDFNIFNAGCYHWQFKMSQILDNNNTHILFRFGIDLQRV